MAKKILIAFFLSLFAFSYVLAAPTITDISGSFSDSAAFTISGSGFGAKIPASPLTFLKDNIEKGVVGSGLSATNWVAYTDSSSHTQPRYNSNESHSGTKSILSYFPDLGHYSSEFRFDMGSGQEVIFLSTWVKLVKNDNNTSFQWKSWRINDLDQYAVHCTIIHDNWWFGEWGNNDVQSYFNSGAENVVIKSLPNDAYLLNTWQRLDMWVKRASGDAVANGQYWLKRVGRVGSEIIASNNGFITHKAGDGQWRYVRMGQYYGNLTPGTERNFKVYYDDIYIDNTQARVEIGNSATWANCTQREIQMPTLWSDNSICIVVNRGSFAEGNSVYLFVVDANGNVNSQGYPITIQKAVAPPSAPKGLRIVN